MTVAPRLEIDLDKIQHNARSLVERLATSGISITAVSKGPLVRQRLLSCCYEQVLMASAQDKVKPAEADVI